MIRNKLLLAAIASWSGKVMTLAVGFLLAPFMLHHLGETQYGLYVLVNSVIGQGAILDFGIRPAVIKYVAEHRAKEDNDRLSSLIATVLVIYCCLGLIALLFTGVLAALFPHLFNLPPDEHKVATILVAVMGGNLAIFIPCGISGAVLTGLHLYGLTNSLTVLGTLASAVAIVGVLVSGGGLIAMVVASVCATLAIQAIAFWCVHRVAPELRFGPRAFRRELVKTVLSFSASMSVMEIADNARARCDDIVIGAFFPVNAVSPYSLARRLGETPGYLAAQAMTAFLPLTSQLEAEGDTDRLRSLYLAGSRVTFAICVPLAGVLIGLAGPLLALWIGSEYAAYAAIVMVFALASVAEISHWPGAAILQGLARHQGLAVANVCAALAKLVLAVLLTRYYGLIGLAFANLIPALALSVSYVFPYTMRILEVSWPELMRQTLLPAFFPAPPMMLVLYGMTWLIEPSGLLSLAGTAGAGLAAYALIYIGLCAGKPEREMLRSFIAATSRILLVRQAQP